MSTTLPEGRREHQVEHEREEDVDDDLVVREPAQGALECIEGSNRNHQDSMSYQDRIKSGTCKE